MINYLGSCGGGTAVPGPPPDTTVHRTVASLHRHLDAETDEALARAMNFPVDWDPFFQDRMTLGQVYRYGTEHFDYHRRQLTL